MQNKLHWAITGRTASEIITERADSSKQNMGLTSWRVDKTIKESDFDKVIKKIENKSKK